jgi:hypothetical protein
MARPGDHVILARLPASRIKRGIRSTEKTEDTEKEKKEAGTDGRHQRHGHAVFFPCRPVFFSVDQIPSCLQQNAALLFFRFRSIRCQDSWSHARKRGRRRDVVLWHVKC